MKSATLVAEALPYMPPTTNHYRTDDGYVLVLVVDVPDMNSILTSMGMQVPVSRSHLKPDVSVFLSDERGQVIDYDGDPANGMTPILSTDSKSFAMTIVPDLHTHTDALAALGYTLIDPPNPAEEIA